MQASKIILMLGDYRQVAEDLNRNPTTVFKWKRDGIPTLRYDEIVELAKRKRVAGITWDVLRRSTPKR